ncbi:MAG: PIN domain-containing protein [Chloroflexi bacterium]|nr:PIN domain-containing protein [Chloroflexota bacterium]
MTTFVDTSAWYAALDEADPNHAPASVTLRSLLPAESLVTHSYVVVETVALVQRRLGLLAVDSFVSRLLGPVRVTWVDPDLHDRAVGAMLAARRHDVSLVDWTSFELMRRQGITSAFAFDSDFTNQGFSVTP